MFIRYLLLIGEITISGTNRLATRVAIRVIRIMCIKIHTTLFLRVQITNIYTFLYLYIYISIIMYFLLCIFTYILNETTNYNERQLVRMESC